MKLDESLVGDAHSHAAKPTFQRSMTRRVIAAIPLHQPKAHSPHGQLLLLRRMQGHRLGWRSYCFLFVNEPSSGLPARVFGRLVWLHVMAAMLLSMAESVDWVVVRVGGGALPWLYARVYLTLFFTAEATLRLIGTSTIVPLRKGLAQGTIYLDLLSVVPFWLRLLFYPTSVTAAAYLLPHSRPLWLRIFEAAGEFRLLKAARNSSGLELLVSAISRSLRELLIPCFMLAIMVVAFSAIMFNLEWDERAYECHQLWKAHGLTRGFLFDHPDGPSWGCDVCDLPLDAAGSDLAAQRCLACHGYPPAHPECAGVAFTQTFPDIPRTMWFTFVTVTTVGYGDVTPVGWIGKIFGSAFILCGVIFLAMPLNSVGAHFSAVWKEFQLHQLKAGMREQLLRKGISPDDVRRAFDEFDEDGNGLIDLKEFSSFITNVLKLRLARPEISTLWRSIDIDGLGEIDFAEFCGTLFPDKIPGLASATDIASPSAADEISPEEQPAPSSRELSSDPNSNPTGDGGETAGDGGKVAGDGGKATRARASADAAGRGTARVTAPVIAASAEEGGGGLAAALGSRLQAVEDRLGSMDTQLEIMRSVSVQVLEMVRQVHAEMPSGSNLASSHGSHADGGGGSHAGGGGGSHAGGGGGRTGTHERTDRSKSRSASPSPERRERTRKGSGNARHERTHTQRAERSGSRAEGSGMGRKPREDVFFDIDQSLSRSMPGAATRDRPASRQMSRRSEQRERERALAGTATPDLES